MLQRLRETLRAPAPLAHDPAYVVRTLNVLATVEMPLLLLPLAQNWALGFFVAVWTMALQDVAILGVLWLSQRKRITAASRLFCFSNWATVICLCAQSSGGSHDVAMLGFPALLMVGGLLLDVGTYLILAGLVLAGSTGLVLAEMHGWLNGPLAGYSSFPLILDLLVVLAFTAAAVALLIRDVGIVMNRARRNELAVAASKAELERQAETLRGSAQKLRTAMELAVEGVAHADSAGLIVQANTRAVEITGYSQQELIGRNFTSFFSAAELQRSPIRWDLLDRGEVVTSERHLTRKDGNVLLVEMTSQRLPDRTLQCFVRDITGRRAQEEQMREHHRLESLGKLASGVAHDFNNLLTIMLGALEAVDAEQALPPSLQSPLQDLKAVAARAGDLTQQLLAFARRRPLERKLFDFRSVLEDNVRLLRRLLGPQIELATDNDSEACYVMADTGMVTQVVMNLAVNARDAMPNGGRLVLGVRIVNVAVAPHLGNRAIEPGRYACLRVTDNGCGMDEATRNRIFEPFFTTKEQGRGTGLGLSVSRGVVEQHGGWIEVTSAVGRGTEFRVYLPEHLPSPEDSRTAARPPPVTAVRGTETILLVEDEEPVRRLAAGALRWSGFRVLEATNGSEAMKIWDQSADSIELLLTDVAMPGEINGVEVTKRCRSRRPELPVVVTSGYSQDAAGLGEGDWDDVHFLPKPYTMASLALAVRTTIDGALARQRG